MAQNGPAILEAHFAVPMAGAVLNALNFRLDAPSIAFMLGHSAAKVILVDREFTDVVKAALAEHAGQIAVVAIDDNLPDPAIGESNHRIVGGNVHVFGCAAGRRIRLLH